MKCNNCGSEDIINYYSKFEGDIKVDYLRCNNCLKCWDEKRGNDSISIIRIKKT
jgi:formate dehydrogenase maturation protein FdhE